jgi:hypothetical protein
MLRPLWYANVGGRSMLRPYDEGIAPPPKPLNPKNRMASVFLE